MSERSIFIEVLEIADRAERDAHLDRACAADLALRRRVEHLLNTFEQARGFMQAPAAALVATSDEPRGTERPGTVIGPYQLLGQLGEGGFGVVYKAEQHYPVRRQVALKVLKPG